MRHHFSHKIPTTFKIHIHINFMSIRLYTNIHLVPESKSSRLKFDQEKIIFHIHITPTFQHVKVSFYTSIHFLKTSLPLVIQMTKFGVENY